MLYQEDGDIYGDSYNCYISKEELLDYVQEFSDGVSKLIYSIQQAYELGYDTGYRNGYDDGHDAGFDGGFNYVMKQMHQNIRRI